MAPLLGELSSEARLKGFETPLPLRGTSPTRGSKNNVTHPPTPLPRRGFPLAPLLGELSSEARLKGFETPLPLRGTVSGG